VNVQSEKPALPEMRGDKPPFTAGSHAVRLLSTPLDRYCAILERRDEFRQPCARLLARLVQQL
jgi:hypothetical protein